MRNTAAASSLALRDAREDDVASLVELINAAYMPIDWWLFEVLRTDDAGLRRLLADPEVQLIVAELEGRVAGHIELSQHDGQPHFGLLAVDVTLQGRGIGRALVAEAERRARAAGHRELRLQCVRENNLEPYYEALGYRAVAEERGRMWDAKHEWTLVHMAKDLP